MMRMRYIHVALCVLAAITAACTADNRELPSAGQPIHEPLQISIAQPQMTVTRSTTDDPGNAWAGNEKIALVVGNSVGAGDTPASLSDHVYTVSASGTSPSLTSSGANFWSSTSESKKIAGAWSYGTTTAPGLTSNTLTLPYTLPTTQTSTTGELLYSPGAATKAYTASPNSFSITFYHQLAKVVFSITADKEQAVTGASMTVPGTITAITTLDDDGSGKAVFTVGSDVTVTPDGTAAQTAGTSTPATYSAVVIPGTYDGKTLLTLTTSANGTYNYTPATLSLQSGKKYTFNITIKNNLVFCNSVSVEAWDTSAAAIPVVL